MRSSSVVPGDESQSHSSRPVQNLVEAQVALARLGISPGSIDGVLGSRTRSALAAFQQIQKLPLTGELDSTTKSRLQLAEPPFTGYVVASEDLARLRPLGKTWQAKSQQDRMDYETILELVAEVSRSSPQLIQRLNPEINWTKVTAGTVLAVPNAAQPAPRTRAAFACIHLTGRALQAFDENTNLMVHFPCSIAAFAAKRPVGELRVEVMASDPNYTFDPENFPESAEARQLGRKLILQPGPNNPVGTVWVGLDKPGYGIHGTPRPEQVGRAESHGCFRLANWNAEYFLQLAWVGMPVIVEP
jgi:lipoprotein-anchoring transpeptidase ErfK/SrfK